MNNKYLEFDKQITKEIQRELREAGTTEYPTTCHYCSGKGCKHCKQTGQIIYKV